MDMYYFKIMAYIWKRKKPLGGIRRYPTDDFNRVRRIIEANLLKYYTKEEIIKIEIKQLPEQSEEVKEYLENYPGK